MIQDIYPHKLNNQYDKDAVASAGDTVICFNDGRILINKDAFENNEIVFPRVSDFKGDHEYRYLFKVDETSFFLLEAAPEEEDIPEGFEFSDERAVRKEGIGPKENHYALVTGKHIADWYRDSKFCGRCGHKMVHSTKERAMKCEICKNKSYPRIMPAVIVGVTNGDRILLTKYATGFKYNALVAGFTEIGETVEETVEREVMEETGVKVKNIRYYKSQPWGSANDILLGFYCDVDGDDTITMDESELKYAEWVKREDIELQPGEFSLTNEMMKMFKENRI
ncbi:MAG: NAD(+) diphosphatase [Eubacteriales bacterium]|nr:NAD(+) diphosphatase [Eubacteriales bacterium]